MWLCLHCQLFYQLSHISQLPGLPELPGLPGLSGLPELPGPSDAGELYGRAGSLQQGRTQGTWAGAEARAGPWLAEEGEETGTGAGAEADTGK